MKLTEKSGFAVFRKIAVLCLFSIFTFSLYAQDADADSAASTATETVADSASNYSMNSKELKKAQKEAEKEAKKLQKAAKKAEAAQKKADKKNKKNKKSKNDAAVATDSAEEKKDTTEAAVKENAGKESTGKDTAANADESKNYTGWIEVKKKNVKDSFGGMQLNIKAKYGSFSLSAVNDLDKEIPLLSTANEFTKNSFYLKMGRKVYGLCTDGSVKTVILRKTNGYGIKYVIDGVADVIVTFDFYPFAGKDVSNIVKVTAEVTNKSKRKDTVSLKAVLDTVLGESAAFHFYTADGVAIKKEVLYRTLQNQKYFVSMNDYATMQMYFSGADCTEPEVLAFANYATLNNNTWEPSMTILRDFDTVYSYNNSAVCAIWKAVPLEPMASSKVVFYLAAVTDGKTLDVAKYFYKSERKAPVEKQPAEDDLVKEVYQDERVSYSEMQRIPADVEPVTEPVKEQVPVVREIPAPVVTPREIPTVDFYIQNMTKDQLTQEYIQSLLDRIAALEDDSPSLNRQELLELNTELDAILTYLRQ